MSEATNGTSEYKDEELIPPSLLATLSDHEKKEALAAAAAARRAEERAERRALERAMERKRLQREKERLEEEEKEREKQMLKGSMGVLDVKMENGNGGNGGGGDNGGVGRITFISKKRRAEMMEKSNSASSSARNTRKPAQKLSRATPTKTTTTTTTSNPKSHLSTAQILSIKKSYLGSEQIEEEETRRKKIEQQRRARQAKKITFKFEWDNSEDTGLNEVDPLYDLTPSRSSNSRSSRGGGYGRGHGSSSSSNANVNVIRPGIMLSSHSTKRDRNNSRGKRKPNSKTHRGIGSEDEIATVQSVSTKPLSKMTPRDWRIFRENYDIVVKGGKAPPPLRTFRDTPIGVPSIHNALLESIEKTLRYKEPSPIQRQAIPIGLQRRDLIGIAETGSGKTAAFGIPLCHHILSLPEQVLDTVAENGPLALVMAPTRELALQIDAEFAKLLSRQKNVQTAAIVGGQPIQQQAMTLREGVHVVVGTPGRINDCVEMAYLVLNQCSYIVLDEADRMIDLGFAPQIEQILDAMGGLLKSTDESEAYQQELEDLQKMGNVIPRHRLTAMFSATMPPEVERIAKRYLRHPAVVTIGDQDSGKNARIVQRVLFLSSPSQKEKALRDLLSRLHGREEKIIVFVNEKKHADGVGRMVERNGRKSVVLHGGKTQEQREENLDLFRRGGVVLVATDVAGRGLDIADVTHVINYDVPSRSIDNYCHRIGRTGRAGKEGYATSFITDADEGIMAPLKQYLESTGMQVPERLARHPAATGGGGMGRQFE